MNIEEYINVINNLRKGVVGQNENGETQVLLASFVGTEQQKDIEQRTPVISDYFRVKINVKAFDDNERAKKNLSPLDFSDTEQVFKAMRDEFDMPYWAFRAFHAVGKKSLKDYNNTFIYQLKACNLHCPWCYVDDSNKDAEQGNNSRFFRISEIVDVFEAEREKQTLNNLRPSGGEPTLAVEQWLLLLKELKKRNLSDVYVQGDSNLTTGNFIEELEFTDEVEFGILRRVGEYKNFGLLSSFKGTDEESFCKATGLSERFAFLHDEQFHTFGKFVGAGIDAYPFIYDSNPKTLENFMERGAREFGEGFYLKTWILPLKLYGPEKARLEKQGINPEKYQQELTENFSKSKEIMQELIWKRFGLNYQAVPRSGIELECKKHID